MSTQRRSPSNTRSATPSPRRAWSSTSLALPSTSRPTTCSSISSRKPDALPRKACHSSVPWACTEKPLRRSSSCRRPPSARSPRSSWCARSRPTCGPRGRIRSSSSARSIFRQRRQRCSGGPLEPARLNRSSHEEVSMRHLRVLVSLAPLCSTLLLADAALADHNMGAAKTKMTDGQIIASAMTAAPAPVGKDATVIDVDEKGTVRTVRKGTNGFTCMADNPQTPGPDPMCADQNAMAWVSAWLSHQAPPANTVGFMYMLAGGTDASNTDPYATEPTKENHWIKTGAHVMVVGASAMAGYPTSADPNTAAPYV